EPCLVLLEVAERHTDGLVGRKEYQAAKRAVSMVVRRNQLPGPIGPDYLGIDCLRLDHLPGWEGTAPQPRFDYLSEEARRNREELRRQGMDVINEEQAIEVQREVDSSMMSLTNLLRDIFGNPFRFVRIKRAWRTSNVLAQAIYTDRAFERL